MGKDNNTKRDVFTRKELIQHGVCPDCWDDMAYYNGFFTYMEDRTKANIHGPKDKNLAFIEQFVQDNITGIKLKHDGKRYYCSNCDRDFLYEPGEVEDQNESGLEESQ